MSSYVQRLYVMKLALAFLLLAGCGSEAMLIGPPHREACEIPVCEKANPRDKECWRTYCMTRRQMEEMVRTAR